MLFFYILFGIFGGVLCGMGLGGGTVLIPLLSFLGENVKIAGAINLVSFIPASIISLIFHVKRSLVKRKGLLIMIFWAVLSAFVAFFIGKRLSKRVLSRIFGGILFFIGLKGVLTVFFKKK